MAKYKNRVRDTTSTTGTGTITFNEEVLISFRTFGSAFTVNDYFPYTIVDTNGAWEVGYGQLLTSTTMSRLYVVESSNADAAIVLSAGSHEVFSGPINLSDKFNGYIVSLAAPLATVSNVATYIDWTNTVDDPLGYISSMLPLTTLPVPAWVDKIDVVIDLFYDGLTNENNMNQIITEVQDAGSVGFTPNMRVRQMNYLDSGGSPGGGLSRPEIALPTRSFIPRTGNGDGIRIYTFHTCGAGVSIASGTSCQVKFVE